MYLLIVIIFCCSACKGTQKQVEKSQTPAAQQQEEPFTALFPTQPVLQLEMGMHSAKINKISSDSSGNYLATTSSDKTLRLFRASDGTLIKTYRPPIGKAEEGRLDAVAISPDSNTIACGGWTGYEWHGSDSIYLFDRESGKMVKRIGRHPGNIMHLVYSKDGKHLVACMAGANGIRVYRTMDYSLVQHDKYGDTTMKADFDDEGNLVTISYDKFLRRYDKNFQLVNKIYIADLKMPTAVCVSSKGDLIAVADGHNPKVNVYSRNLQYLFSPIIFGYSAGAGIFAVRFSKDGNLLYAGGQTSKIVGNQRANYILIWDNGGKGNMQEVVVGTDSIMHLDHCGDKVAFCAADPKIGLLSSTSLVYSIPSVLCDFRTMTARMKISKNGKDILFGVKENHLETQSFSFDTFRHTNNPAGLEPSKERFIHSYGIYEWKNFRDYALINGLKIFLQKHEVSRSLAISADENNFALGSDWNVRYFNRSGMVLWQKSIPAVAWDINISGDGRFVITALSNGTIRWLRARDGEEILNFFPHANKKDWIAWTPKGFYATSEGADSLFGWHVNQDRNKEALFFPAFVFAQYF